MKEAYEQFKQLKNKQREAHVKERSRITLEWYEKIGLMLDDPAYEYAYTFLYSVCEFIETKEYISDGQITAVENVIDAHENLPF